MADEDEEAIVCHPSGKRFTWKEIRERVYRLANGLYDIGVRNGDVVSVLLYNGNEIVEALYGASMLGCVVPLVNWHSKGEELKQVLIGQKTTDIILDQDFIPAIEEIKRELNVRSYIVVGDEAPDGMILYEDLMKRYPGTVPENVVSRIGIQMFTAGTTGTPKGLGYYKMFDAILRPAAVSFDEMRKDNPAVPMDMMEGMPSIMAMMPGFRELEFHKHDNILLLPAPFYHPGALVEWGTSIMAGGKTVMMRKFNAEEFLRLIQEEKVAYAYTPPVLLQRLLAAPEEIKKKYDTSSLHSLICGAAYCPPKTKKAINEWFGRPVYHEWYLSSDNITGVFLGPDDYLEDEKRYESCGRSTGHLLILDEDGNRLPPGEVGELWGIGMGVFTTYSGTTDKMADKVRKIDGKWYFDEGELAYMDEDGYVYIKGRKKDMIISGAVNIYPDDIEKTILRHPKVADVAVIGVPDEDLGEHVHACVQLKEGESMKEKEIIEFCKNEGLSGYKKPKSADFHGELPRREDGKILKRMLKEKYR
jgi:long-chain acyl-CoA synthetase